jgi:hypothetical protein
LSPQPAPPTTLADQHETDQQGGFLPAVTERLGSYVYLLIDPRNDRIFHVGTGTGERCFRDLHRASAEHSPSTVAIIREVEAAGQRVRIDILRHGLDPQTASTVEAAVVEALGTSNLREHGVADPTSGVGRMSVGELNTLYGATPVTIHPEHAVVLIPIPRAFRRGTDRQLYEITRGWWKAGARRERAQWAFAVCDGVVRAVYRIKGWEPARAGNRWGFRGHRDPEMERDYLHRDVSGYLGSGNVSNLKYVNC